MNKMFEKVLTEFLFNNNIQKDKEEHDHVIRFLEFYKNKIDIKEYIEEIVYYFNENEQQTMNFFKIQDKIHLIDNIFPQFKVLIQSEIQSNNQLSCYFNLLSDFKYFNDLPIDYNTFNKMIISIKINNNNNIFVNNNYYKYLQDKINHVDNIFINHFCNILPFLDLSGVNSTQDALFNHFINSVQPHVIASSFYNNNNHSLLHTVVKYTPEKILSIISTISKAYNHISPGDYILKTFAGDLKYNQLENIIHSLNQCDLTKFSNEFFNNMNKGKDIFMQTLLKCSKISNFNKFLLKLNEIEPILFKNYILQLEENNQPLFNALLSSSESELKSIFERHYLEKNIVTNKEHSILKL